MTNYKNQHFVPRFYLKNFSNEGTIGIYNLKSKSFYRRSYRSICAKKYFYSKDPELEKFYSMLEGKYSEAISKLIKIQDMSKLSAEENSNLLSFITFQRTRANKGKRNSEIELRSMEEMLKYSMSLEIESGKSTISKERINDIKISWNVHRFQIGYEILFGPLLLSDLESCIILNRTDHDFVISDEPVVSFNSCYGITGLQSPGLQIFCPLSKEMMLLLYDPMYYHFFPGSKIEVFNVVDIDSINKLQFFNSYNNIFFLNDNELNHIKNLHSQIEYLLENGGNRIEAISHENIKEKSRLYSFSSPSINYDLNLSFMNIIPPSASLVPLARSKEIIELSDLLWKKIRPQWAK
jgi:hypothetical protein